jgi:RNA polymerase sigma factor (sigma-70 family)
VFVQESTGGEVRINAPDRSFERFAAVEGERLRRALVAAYGIDVGSDACAEALAWAWEHWARVSDMANPVGYLFRVGQSATRRHRRWRRRRVWLPNEVGDAGDTGEMSGRLDEALVALSERQRAVVLLVHGYDYSYAEVAEMTGTSLASVRNDLHRAMKRLRTQLEAQ